MKRGVNGKNKTSEMFITGLAVVSIAGFIGIISKSIFNFELDTYVNATFMLVVGIALLIDADFKTLRTLKYGVTPKNFSHLTLAVIGTIAVIAGIFTIPQISIDHFLFQSTKGIISIIAIIVIVVQTWFTRTK